MAGIENGRQSHAALQRADHDPVHLVVGNVAGLSEVNWVDNLVVPIGLVAVEILCLPAVAWQVIVRSNRGWK